MVIKLLGPSRTYATTLAYLRQMKIPAPKPAVSRVHTLEFWRIYAKSGTCWKFFSESRVCTPRFWRIYAKSGASNFFNRRFAYVRWNNGVFTPNYELCT